MENLAQIIKEQKRDNSTFKIYYREENVTLIRPHIHRFADFPGETTKQKAFSVLKYFGWKNKEIISALNLTVSELASMQDILSTTENEDLREKFFNAIPAKSVRNKAILIFRGLKWTQKEVGDLFNISRKQVYRLTLQIRKNCQS